MDKNYITFKANCWYDDDDKTYYANVPYFENIFTDGESIDEIKINLIDIMTLTIIDMEHEGVDYYELLEKNLNSNVDNPIDVVFFLPYERSKVKEFYKKKTLTIPTWLDDLATNKNLNFSQILQKALKKELNIH